MPGTCDSREVTTSAISSWFLTRTITTKSNSPVTEYASATPGTSASAGPSLAIADRSALLQTPMSVVAAPSRSSPVSERLRRDTDEYLDLLVGDLPSSDITSRLKRLGYVRDRLSLAFSKEAARLSAEFRESETADR